jgi:hypothetical protein
MLSKSDRLLEEYEHVVSEPWSTSLSGQERVWFLVYEPSDQRMVEYQIGDFETATLKAGKKWNSISLKECFPLWLTQHEYRDDYFRNPKFIIPELKANFGDFAVNFLRSKLRDQNTDPDTLTAITDVSSLYSFIRLSELLRACDKNFKGRLLIFFPGEFENNQYRLLNARDGWNYLARPITL